MPSIAFLFVIPELSTWSSSCCQAFLTQESEEAKDDSDAEEVLTPDLSAMLSCGVQCQRQLMHASANFSLVLVIDDLIRWIMSNCSRDGRQTNRTHKFLKHFMSYTDLVHNKSQLEAPAESPAASVSSSDLIGTAKEIEDLFNLIYFNILPVSNHQILATCEGSQGKRPLQLLRLGTQWLSPHGDGNVCLAACRAGSSKHTETILSKNEDKEVCSTAFFIMFHHVSYVS